jgi:hypothetical protein
MNNCSGGFSSSSMGGAASAAASRYTETVKAAQTLGAIVKVKPENFLRIISRTHEALVVYSISWGLFRKYYQYLTSYKGLVFYTGCYTELQLPEDIELIEADSIWIPSY